MKVEPIEGLKIVWKNCCFIMIFIVHSSYYAALSLLKSFSLWNDRLLNEYDLGFLGTKEKPIFTILVIETECRYTQTMISLNPYES